MKKVKLFEEFLVESVSLIYESSIGDIHIMAQEADSFTAFRKEFMDEYGKPKSVKELKQLEAWLQTIWNENQTNEALSMDAVYIHQITGSGQDSAQNFIDDNNIDSAKLVAFLKQHKDSKEKYDVRDMINGTNKNKRFMKQFLNEASDAKPAILVKLYNELAKAKNKKSLTWDFDGMEEFPHVVQFDNGLESEAPRHEGDLEEYSFYLNDDGKTILGVYDLNGYVQQLKTVKDAIEWCRANE